MLLPVQAPAACAGSCLQPLHTCPGRSSCCWQHRAQSTAWEPTPASSAPGQHIQQGWSRSCSGALRLQWCPGAAAVPWSCSLLDAAAQLLTQTFSPPLLTPKLGQSLCSVHFFLLPALGPVLFCPQYITAGIGCTLCCAPSGDQSDLINL